MQSKIRMLFTASIISGALLSSCNNEGTSTEEKDSMVTTTDHATLEQPKEEAGVMVGGASMVPSKDIIDNAVNSSDHTTLVAAVKEAGLVETLKGEGPFTVFAPTNEAFNKLPAGTVDKLLMPEMKADLTNVLTYHVVPGSFKSTDLKDGQKLKTVQGTELTIGNKDGKWTVNKANITIANVISSNGVTYVIDDVLMPETK
ncbi:MAG: fasciclin domain-containing protein [Chitinophagaceae bacterium]